MNKPEQLMQFEENDLQQPGRTQSLVNTTTRKLFPSTNYMQDDTNTNPSWTCFSQKGYIQPQNVNQFIHNVPKYKEQYFSSMEVFCDS